ncbi:FAD-dependent oxidoreductase [Amycolatopsis sp. H20-H5]|uniref:FAD-dependent oxidoreductase n=1 Tax=Amycolatopsis sp. H20-H5 TaxID=3046309 RepID=UPI002DBB6591|nr:NAD(P)/FAD-dependent oxidoreductase [Amycolatopsis sp. H20-H5]MEC3981256.1 NAD(P)/FAD-dependent oxidoreductase [Amycolatopsis sp. H20-H5]
MTGKLRVAVIGGGTGGLCLAQGLHQAGVDVAVYERSRTRTERLQGYRVHINPQGARALHECLPSGLWDAFVATSGEQDAAFGFVTEQLRELLLLGEDLIRSSAPESSHYSVSRITLHQVLSSGLAGVLHYDKRFERYEQDADGEITCFFADGSTAVADVVIGADGSGSPVRGQRLPHAVRKDTGILAIAGKFRLTDESRRLLPARLVDGPNSVMPPRGCGMFVAPHRMREEVNGFGGNDVTAEADGVLFDNTGSYLMWAYAADRARYPDPAALSTMAGGDLRDLVGGLIADWHPGLRRVVADSPAGTVTMLPIWTSEPVDAWEPSPVTLLGDAIHSMTPFRGIGANIALRDARLLCRNLVAADRGRDLLDAIGDYERQMREYGFAAVRDSLRSAEQFVSDSRVGRGMAKGMFRLFEAVPPLKRRVFSEPAAS